MRKISLALSLLLSAGCAQNNTGFKDRYIGIYSAPNVRSDFDELLNFSANMATIPASSRNEICSSLLKSQKKSGMEVQLHLLVGRLYSDACGDIPSVLDGIASLPPGSLQDEHLQKLIAIHTEALKRMNNLSKKVGTLERKQKTVQTVLESKDTSGSKNDEARLLRDKLEAIRSMEKQLDETGDGK